MQALFVNAFAKKKNKDRLLIWQTCLLCRVWLERWGVHKKVYIDYVGFLLPAFCVFSDMNTIVFIQSHHTKVREILFFQFQGNPYSNRTTCLRTCTLQPPPPFHKSFPPTPSPFFINEETYLVSIETSLILIFKLFICLILFCKVNRKNVGAFKTANNKKKVVLQYACRQQWHSTAVIKKKRERKLNLITFSM